MISVLAFVMFAQIPQEYGPRCFNCVYVAEQGPGGRAQATITISLEITSNHLAFIDMQQVDPDIEGVYRLSVRELTVGVEDAFNSEQDVLVMDDYGILKDQLIQLAFLGEERVDIVAPEMVALYQWPGTMTNEAVAEVIREGFRPEAFAALARLE
jgi:hypothetical protein